MAVLFIDRALHIIAEYRQNTLYESPLCTTTSHTEPQRGSQGRLSTSATLYTDTTLAHPPTPYKKLYTYAIHHSIIHNDVNTPSLISYRVLLTNRPFNYTNP